MKHEKFYIQYIDREGVLQKKQRVTRGSLDYYFRLLKNGIINKLEVEQVGDGTKNKYYLNGFNCGLHGSTIQNAHFTFFDTPQHTADWERGKKDGEKEKLENEAWENEQQLEKSAK